MDLVTNSVSTVARNTGGRTNGIGTIPHWMLLRTLHIIANNSILMVYHRETTFSPFIFKTTFVKIVSNIRPCLPCPPNSVSAFNNTGCTCADDVFDASTGTCAPCTAGKYQSITIPVSNALPEPTPLPKVQRNASHALCTDTQLQQLLEF